MGMFDEIRIEQILPGNSEITDGWYQTKSFGRYMGSFVITAKGELYEERWDWEWVEDPYHFLGGYSQKIEGSFRREYLTDYHGDVIFYSSKLTDNKEDNRTWRDYHARFTEGKLTKMWYVDKQY